MKIQKKTAGMILGIAMLAAVPMAMGGCSAGEVGADAGGAGTDNTDNKEAGADVSGAGADKKETGAEAGGAGADNTDKKEAEAENGGAGTGTGETSGENPQGMEEKAAQNENGELADSSRAVPAAPKLPQTGRKLSDFVPEGWELMDSVELDFNQDGVVDYVGVQEAVWQEGDYQDYPRILFALASDVQGRYRLDFQDVNLIRARYEGGVFGDPYCPLTAEGTSFTTHSYGGSAWRWSEDFTYTYREGTWYLTLSEETYGYWEYVTDISRDDWERGTGIRKKRSSEFGDMEKHWEEEEPEYDLVYELSLDEPVTLRQASLRWWLAPDRVTDWEVKSIEFAEDVKLPEDGVSLPDSSIWAAYCDEDCVLYKFSNRDTWRYYLAMYRWQDKALFILAETETFIDDLQLYKGKIYYTTEIVENIKYKTMQEGKEQTAEEEDTIGMRLNRMNTDGTGKEVIFEYLCPEAGQEVMECRPPYLALIYEISGDEIVAEVYNGDGPHPYYRMNADGSGLRAIGQVPRE